MLLHHGDVGGIRCRSKSIRVVGLRHYGSPTRPQRRLEETIRVRVVVEGSIRSVVQTSKKS